MPRVTRWKELRTDLGLHFGVGREVNCRRAGEGVGSVRGTALEHDGHQAGQAVEVSHDPLDASTVRLGWLIGDGERHVASLAVYYADSTAA